MDLRRTLAGLELCFAMTASVGAAERHTAVSIAGDEFRINGKPTYAGRRWNGHNIQGLLLNSRMVQGIFDDLNTNTVSKWAYPDTGKWDPERATRVSSSQRCRSGGSTAYSRSQSIYKAALRRVTRRKTSLGTIRPSSKMAPCARTT